MECCSFLNEAMRVADAKYEPTFDDILRARLQTVGVEEHRLVIWGHTEGEGESSPALADDVGSQVVKARGSPYHRT